eukprot:4637924-Pleurochrysis_carterae.AAC.1
MPSRAGDVRWFTVRFAVSFGFEIFVQLPFRKHDTVSAIIQPYALRLNLWSELHMHAIISLLNNQTMASLSSALRRCRRNESRMQCAIRVDRCVSCR